MKGGISFAVPPSFTRATMRWHLSRKQLTDNGQCYVSARLRGPPAEFYFHGVRSNQVSPMLNAISSRSFPVFFHDSGIQAFHQPPAL
jgi:hypothetical protein